MQDIILSVIFGAMLVAAILSFVRLYQEDQVVKQIMQRNRRSNTGVELKFFPPQAARDLMGLEIKFREKEKEKI
jgi:hypothetical protein